MALLKFRTGVKWSGWEVKSFSGKSMRAAEPAISSYIYKHLNIMGATSDAFAAYICAYRLTVAPCGAALTICLICRTRGALSLDVSDI